MKKLSFLLMALTIAIVASGEPANPIPVSITQPDGTKLQLKLVGDEFYHFNTTIDGYTIVNVNGKWEYAMKSGNKLTSTGVLAHDPEVRNTQEQQFLSTTAKYLVDEQGTNNAQKARSSRDKKNQGQKDPVIDYSQFRGLIILINFNDRQFLMDDPNDFYDKLCNTENYSGFYHNGRFQRCTGSVRDYYYDNSMGQFDPDFDIVGPVNLDYSCYEGNDKAREIFKASLDAVDDQVDFSLYDADNDGEIDMVFFMVAGYSSSYSGNNDGYLWPHMSYLIDWWSGWPPQPYVYDGKTMGTYASSCEIYGWESQGTTMPNAIGTICHEFGHVLGLPDLYDTDYSSSGGESNHPGSWDVMAGGSGNNYGRNPVGYSLWERWELGFTDTPAELSLGAQSLTAVDVSNTGYMMQSPNENEFFLFENRQPGKWDSALPGHGLVITRVDYSNEQAWWNNEVNCNPAHNYYELIHASGSSASGVPFPGQNNVNYINSSSDPGLVTWAGEACQYALNNIAENNNVISFNVVADVPPLTLIEDFDQIPTQLPANSVNVQGNFATWNFPKSNVVEYNGTHVASLQMPGGIAMNSDIDVQPIKISINANNTSSTASKIQLYCSTDKGATWNSIGIATVGANTEDIITWRTNLDQKSPVRFKINRTSGAKNVDLIIDNFTIYYFDSATPGDVNGDGSVTSVDVTALYNYLLDGDSSAIENGDQDGDGKITAGDITVIYNILLGN